MKDINHQDSAGRFCWTVSWLSHDWLKNPGTLTRATSTPTELGHTVTQGVLVWAGVSSLESLVGRQHGGRWRGPAWWPLSSQRQWGLWTSGSTGGGWEGLPFAHSLGRQLPPLWPPRARVQTHSCLRDGSPLSPVWAPCLVLGSGTGAKVEL